VRSGGYRVATSYRRLTGTFRSSRTIWLPFAQYTPKFVQDWLAARFNVGEEINLLTAQELQDLFPDADIVRERFLRVTKSLIAIGTSN